jgi:hypothetical protein
MKMSKHCYVDKKFKKASMLIIQQANEIIDEYMADGFKLTLRQLYYQFVSRDLLANKQSEYKRLGSIISDGRLAGLIDWNAIEDRTRVFKRNAHWTDPGEIIEATIHNFHLDYWEGQQYRPEVWIEKQALEGVISGICSELDVRYFACKGYVSQSKMWNAAMRMKRVMRESGQTPVIVHLGDHDPSGIDMTRDIDDRQDLFGCPIILKRIALNMDQVEQYDPPPNPAKLSDTRAEGYIQEFGNSSWELDALEPRVLSRLIRETVEGYRDDEIYQDVIDREMQHKAKLEYIAENWESI